MGNLHSKIRDSSWKNCTINIINIHEPRVEQLDINPLVLEQC